MKKQIVVTSSSLNLPRRVAGHSFIGAKAYPPDTFTAEELKAIIADRMLTVVVGEVLDADGVDGFIRSVEAAKEKAAAATKANGA